MRLKIIAVGRLKSGPERELVEIYRARLKSAPAQLGPLDIVEIDERKDAAKVATTLKDVASALAPASQLIAMDERGETLSTKRLAERLATWRDAGAAEAAFLIGGADGLPEEVRRQAQAVLSFGPLTWPHRLARAMLAEQLYRAASFLTGHPYHRE